MKKRKVFNYSKLKGKMIEKYGSQINFLNNLSMSEATFIKSTKCERYFDQGEILEIADLLEIEHSDIDDYFFSTQS